jgi:hypothetical protein
LERWKFRQLTDACYANPSIQKGQYKWTPEGYNTDMIEKAFEQVDNAADAGTLIHEAIENHFTGADPDYDYSKKVEVNDTDAPLSGYVQQVSDWVLSNDVVVNDCEVRLVNKEYGYAGLTDATINRNGKQGIMDFKTRRTKEGQKVTPYDEHPTQIAAYHMAKYGAIDKDAIGCNLYISTTEIGRIEAIWYNAEDLQLHWEKFKLTLSLWQIIKKYKTAEK